LILDTDLIESGTDNFNHQRDYLYFRTYLMDDILEQAVLACENWVKNGTVSTWRVSKG